MSAGADDTTSIDTAWIHSVLQRGLPVHLMTSSGNLYRLTPLPNAQVEITSINALRAGEPPPLVADRTDIGVAAGRFYAIVRSFDRHRELRTSRVSGFQGGSAGDLADRFVSDSFDAYLGRGEWVYVECSGRSSDRPNNVYAIRALDAAERAAATRAGSTGATHEYVDVRSFEKGHREPVLTDEVGLLGLGRPMVLGMFSNSGRVLLAGSVVGVEGEGSGLEQQFNQRIARAAITGPGSGAIARTASRTDQGVEPA
jgi:hypothetical protein